MINRQELAAEDFSSAESYENGGILYVFPIFKTARIGRKIRRPAADDLFRDSRESDAVYCGRESGFGCVDWHKWNNNNAKSTGLRK